MLRKFIISVLMTVGFIGIMLATAFSFRLYFLTAEQPISQLDVGRGLLQYMQVFLIFLSSICIFYFCQLLKENSEKAIELERYDQPESKKISASD